MFTIEGKNLMLDAVGNKVNPTVNIAYVGLLGENEDEFANPEYARQPIMFNPASDGKIIADMGDGIYFDLGGSPIVTKAIFMSAVTGGVKLAEKDVTVSYETKLTSVELEIV